MPDAHKPFGQDMQKKTPDKFHRLKSRCLHLFGFAVLIGECDLAIL